ncbi:MAG: FAD-dependent oxidoreductase [Dehalococcoidales bacterium]|nr:FAD-dependent oxidoreductase [Dehalococcoidales bacterium]
MSDLVIIGAGGSGLAAAVAAASRGVKVLVIDKRHSAGGTMNMLAGLVAAESPTQKRAGINITVDDLFLKHMQFSHWKLNPRIVRAWLDRSGETIAWLEERGVTFQMFSMFTDEPPTSWHWGLRVGADIVKVLMKECQRFGVQFIFDTRAKQILIDESGKVTGITALEGDNDIEFKAKAVIIATGGYGGNRQMLAEHCPSYLNQLPAAGIETSHSGDGIQMAFTAGAENEGLGNLLMCGPCFVGGFGAFHLAIEPTTIWVNKNGRRFIEEGLGCSPFEAPNAILRQPEQVCFSVFDEGIVQQVLNHGYIRPDAHTVSPVNKIEGALQDSLVKGNLMKALTTIDLAEWIGAEPTVFQSTIEKYNQFCEDGHDGEFSKNSEYLKALCHPPYYAAKCYPWHLGTVGGIRINERMQVLNKNQQPIRGLYAVGSDTGGWSASTYNRYLAGAGASYAINSGMIGGENVANYVSMEEPSG